MRFKVVITDSVFPNLDQGRELLSGIADLVSVPERDKSALKSLLLKADAVLNGALRIPEPVVLKMDRCKIICRAGIGVDTIPLESATTMRIKVANVPDYCVEEVADHTMAIALSLARGVDEGGRQTRAGGWNLHELRAPLRLRGLTFGLAGYGRIARAVAIRALAFGFKVIAYQKPGSVPGSDEPGVEWVSKDELLRRSDILSLHIPLVHDTRLFINESAISRMKKSAILVNTSRGGLVDFGAVSAALRERRLAGAGLDVLEQEPPASSEMLRVPHNLIVTPHTAFYSEQSMEELQRRAFSEIATVLQGGQPASWVNRW